MSETPDRLIPHTIETARSSKRPGTTAAEVFVGGGELGELCRAKDWSATTLGPVDGWPQSLKTAISITLASDFPMIVLWGPELIQIYNDAYRLLMGTKHPAGLGQGNRECWPEVWDINEPIYARVFDGETISFREAMYPLAPRGYIEETYLTLCYNPIRDERGAVGGVFVTVFNVTSEVRTREERDRALAEAKAGRERLAEVFQQSPSFIATVRGPDHVFEMVNPPYNLMINHRPVIGKPVREALPEVVEQGFIGLLDQVYRTGEPFVGTEVRVELQHVPDGPLVPRYVNFVYQPLRDHAGAIDGILAHGVDVTDQVLARRDAERQTEQLTRITRALARSNRELDQFAYVASHDLKAPLRGIANLAAWIEEDLGDEIDGEIRENLELLRGRVYRMEALIDGILAYSRVGRTGGEAETVRVRQLLDDVIDLLAPPEHVTIEVSSEMPTLTTERMPLQQVFQNLIGNAIKHGEGSDLRVRVTARDRGAFYEFTVADNGPGIAPEYHERVFGIFQTLASRDRVEGSGLGLALVRKIVEHHGGTVSLTSAEGEGASFMFTWPREARAEER